MLLISTHCIWHMLRNMDLHDKGAAGGERLKQGVTDAEFEAKGSQSFFHASQLGILSVEVNPMEVILLQLWFKN